MPVRQEGVNQTTSRTAQQSLTHVEEHAQIVLHTFHHLTHTKLHPVVATLRLFTTNLG